MPAESVTQPLSHIEDEYYAYLLGVNLEAEIPLSELEEECLGNIDALLTSVHDTCDSLPRLPEVLPKLMMAIRDERASWEGITDIINQDTLLVAEVLRLANSPIFQTAAKVSSLDQIVMQLGTVGLREVVVTVSLKPVMKFERGQNTQHMGRNIWVQAQSAAVACRNLASAQPQYHFEAYLAGLVHNIGLIVVAHSLQKTLKKHSGKASKAHSMLFCKHIQNAVKRLSFMVATHWELPEPTLAALKQQIAPVEPFESALGHILQCGIQLSRLSELQREGVINDAAARLALLPEDEQSTSQDIFEQLG